MCLLTSRSDTCKSAKSFANFGTRSVSECGTLPAAATARGAGIVGRSRPPLLASAESAGGRLGPCAAGGDAVCGRRQNDFNDLCYATILLLTLQSTSFIQIIMKVRRCEYCKRRLAVGMRIDAVFCGDACRVSAHKQRKRDARKQRDLSIITAMPPVSYPMSPDWEGIIKHMNFTYPGDDLVVGYRLFKNGSIYPNPKDPLRVVKESCEVIRTITGNHLSRPLCLFVANTSTSGGIEATMRCPTLRTRSARPASSQSQIRRRAFIAIGP